MINGVMKMLAGMFALMLGASCETSTKSDLLEREQAQKNKEVVLNFYQQMFGDRDISAVDRYIDKNYIQHNPKVADGAEAFKAAAATWFQSAEKIKVDVQHIAAEGDLVFIHIKNRNKDGSLKSTIDIFRLQGGKIVEHWDVHENVPEISANPHPMF